MSLSVKPSDLAKLATFKQKLARQQAAKVSAPAVTKAHIAGLDPADGALKAAFAAETAVYKRDIDTATRRRLAGEGHALPATCPTRSRTPGTWPTPRTWPSPATVTWPPRPR